MAFGVRNYPQFCLCISMSVSGFPVNVVTMLFINLAVVLELCFANINSCSYELIQCAGEELVGLYRQMSTVKHPQQLIEVNFRSVKSKSTNRACKALFVMLLIF